MPVISPVFPSPSSGSVSAALPDAEGPDIWFDAIDHIELDETWFDAREDCLPEQAATADMEAYIPLTEDCRRCIKQMIRQVADVKESELIYGALARLLPGLPASVFVTAKSLYSAATEGKNIDLAVLNALGLASSSLLADGNVVSRAAHYLQETMLDWLGDSYAGQFLRSDDNAPAAYVFTGLAALAIAARYWMTEEGAPQRRLLRAPVFMANVLLRANSYWRQLAGMAQHAHDVHGARNQNAPSALEVKSHAEIIYGDRESWLSTPADDGHVADPRLEGITLAAFHANATVRPERLERLCLPSQSSAPSNQDTCHIALALHRNAISEAMRRHDVAGLLHCESREDVMWQKQGERWLLASDIYTRCAAAGQPLPDRQDAPSPPHEASRAKKTLDKVPERSKSYEGEARLHGNVSHADMSRVILPKPAAWLERPWFPVASADGDVPEITRLTVLPTPSARSAIYPHLEKANDQVLRMLRKHKRKPEPGKVETYVTELLELAKKDGAWKRRLAKAILRGQGRKSIANRKTLDPKLLNDTLQQWLKANGLDKYADQFEDSKLWVNRQNRAVCRLLEKNGYGGMKQEDKTALLSHSVLFVRQAENGAERFARSLLRSDGGASVDHKKPLSAQDIKETIYNWLMANDLGLYIGTFVPDRHWPQQWEPKQEDEAIILELKKNKYSLDERSNTSLVTQVMQFAAQKPDGKERVVRAILRARGEFGGLEHETLDPRIRETVFRDYLTNSLFGSDIGTFLVEAASLKEGRDTLTLKEIASLISSEIYAWKRFPLPISDALWDEIVTAVLPILSRERFGSVSGLPIDYRTGTLSTVPFEWGDVNAGLLLAAGANASVSDVSSGQALLMGQAALGAMNDGGVPPEWIRFWELPSMLHQAKETAGAAMHEAGDRDKNAAAVMDYLADRETYFEENDAVKIFNERLASFNTTLTGFRTLLEIESGLGGGLYMTNILDAMNPQAGFGAKEAFAKQNRAIADAYAPVDRFLLLMAILRLSEEDYAFLDRAVITQLKAEPRFESKSPIKTKVVVNTHRRLVDVDLFSAKDDFEERFYTFRVEDGGYKICREDFELGYWLKKFLSGKKIKGNGPNNDRHTLLADVKEDGAILKSGSHPLIDIVPEIARRHNEAYVRDLTAKGTEDPVSTKVLTFLVPGLAGIKALEKGDYSGAGFNFGMDLLNAVPVGRLAGSFARFSKLAVYAAASAWRRSAASKAVVQLIKLQGGGSIRYRALPGANALNDPWLRRAVGMETLSGFDADVGFGVGRRGIQQFARLAKMLAKDSEWGALEPVAGKLENAAKDLADSVVPHRYVQQRGIDRVIPVMRAAGEKYQGKPVYLKLDPETGLRGTKRYTLADDNWLEAVPNKAASQIKIMLEEGLSGRGGRAPRRVTKDILVDWLVERDSGISFSGFARKHNIGKNSIRMYVNAERELNYFGKCLVRGIAPMQKEVTSAVLVRWKAEYRSPNGISPARDDFAAQVGISGNTLGRYLVSGGRLSARATALAKEPQWVSAEILDVFETYYGLGSAENRDAFSALCGIDSNELNFYINDDGSLTALGLRLRRDKYGNPVRSFVRDFPDAARDLEAYAIEFDLDREILQKYVNDDGRFTPLGEELFAMPSPASNAKYNQARMDVIAGNRELAERHPDLQLQEAAPSPKRLFHDVVALDDDEVVDADKVAEKLIRGPGHFDPAVDIDMDVYAVQFDKFSGILEEAYEASPTFRRLFNYAYENELKYPDKRWLLATDAAFQTGCTPKQIAASGGRKILGINFDTDTREEYRSADGMETFDNVRGCLHEVIHALSYLPDQEWGNPRGPVVEYTNIILKEMDRDSPARIAYESD